MCHNLFSCFKLSEYSFLKADSGAAGYCYEFGEILAQRFFMHHPSRAFSTWFTFSYS